jgi:hypothetical protein
MDTAQKHFDSLVDLARTPYVWDQALGVGRAVTDAEAVARWDLAFQELVKMRDIVTITTQTLHSTGQLVWAGESPLGLDDPNVESPFPEF